MSEPVAPSSEPAPRTDRLPQIDGQSTSTPSASLAQPTAVKAFPTPQGSSLPDKIFHTDQVITGEAVALEVRPASPLLLIGAGVIDLVSTFALILAFTIFLTQVGSVDLIESGTYSISAMVLAAVFVPATVETLTQGRSLGKWAVGVQIIRDDGGPIRFRHALIRALTGLLEILSTLGSIALITTITNARHKRLGDFLAGTYPAIIKAGEAMPPPLMMPPELIAWAHTVDISRLPGSLAWQTRQFLNQATGLESHHRQSISLNLAAQVESLVSVPPPWGTHPERFLAAVLVVRRDTEFRIAIRAQEELRHRLNRRTPYGL